MGEAGGPDGRKGRSRPAANPFLSTCEAPRASYRSKEHALNEPAIRAFLTAEYPRLVGSLALAAGSRPAAEDAVQEALARAWERSERGEHIESLGAWVTTVAMNLIRSRWRRAMAERRARDRAPGPAPILAPDEEAMDLHRALGALPRRQREVTVLRYLLGHDVESVARVLGVSPGTVKTSLHRARRALAEALGEKEGDHVGA